MGTVPLLQVALDFTSLPAALAVALEVAPAVDIIEIGTPLCKAAGMDAVRSVREVCPDNLILADMKSPDVGGLEAQLAFDAGADMMTVIGGAPLATVQAALDVAHAHGKEMLMELTGVRDILARAKEWRQIGVERIVYHRGWDEQAADRQWEQKDLDTVARLIDMGYKVTVTGGITIDLLPFFRDLPVSIIIVGRGIHQADDPLASARAIKARITELWGSTYGTQPIGQDLADGLSFVDRAAKAIRWGVSEMGLMLTVDGRDCAGCDSPQRLCLTSRSDICSPAGTDAQQIVRAIERSFGASPAYGRSGPNVFYLDPAPLVQAGSTTRVISLLEALGRALQQNGVPVNLGAGIDIASRILGL